MTKDMLFNLLDELSLPDNIIRKLDAPHWCIWKKKKHIKGTEVFQVLREFIELRSEKSDTEVRENAYAVSAKLLHKTFDPDFCQFFIGRLEVETNKYVLHTILDGIKQLRLPEALDIGAIVTCSKSGEWLVRHSAIMALGSSSTDTSREAVRYWVKQEDEKQCKFELIYANAVLGYIGEPGDIDLLTQHISSRIPDVKDSAIYAIDNIKKRYGMAP